MRRWRVHGVKGSDTIVEEIVAESTSEATRIFHEMHPGYQVFTVHPL